MAEKSIKDVLMEKTSTDLGQSLDIVESVIGWGMRDAFKALKKYEEVEISGFGKYIISQSKLKKRIVSCERILHHLSTHPQTEERDQKIESVTQTLQYYYSKIKTNENNKEDIQTNGGGMAQSPPSPGTPEGTNSCSGE